MDALQHNFIVFSNYRYLTTFEAIDIRNIVMSGCKRWDGDRAFFRTPTLQYQFFGMIVLRLP